jgi:integrase
MEKNGKPFHFPLSGEAVAVLEAIRAGQGHEYRRQCASRARRGQPPLLEPEHVFTYKLKPVDDANGAAFAAACERAGVPWCTWHTFRHTGASWGAQNGVTLEQRMKQGGWKDMRMAMRYSHLEDTHIAAAAEVVAQRLHTAVIVKSRGRVKKRA